MFKRAITFAFVGLSIAVALAACAQIIGIDDLPPEPEPTPDAMPGSTPDAMPAIEPALVSLSVSGIAPAITLMPDVTEYAFDVPLSQQTVTVTAITNAQAMSLTINGKPVVGGMPSEPIPLALDENPIDVVVSGTAGAMRNYLLILRRADQLAQYAYVKASNTGSNDGFSNAIAVSGDTIAVGAFNEDGASAGINGDQSDGAGQDYGAVYVFRRVGNIWAQEAYIKAPNPDAGDNFGYSAALSGDTLVVGAPGEDSAATVVNGDDFGQLG